jgi:hypothetical protein
MPCHYLSLGNIIRKEQQPPTSASTYSDGSHHRLNNSKIIESLETANDLAMIALPSLRIASAPK